MWGSLDSVYSKLLVSSCLGTLHLFLSFFYPFVSFRRSAADQSRGWTPLSGCATHNPYSNHYRLQVQHSHRFNCCNCELSAKCGIELRLECLCEWCVRFGWIHLIFNWTNLALSRLRSSTVSKRPGVKPLKADLGSRGTFKSIMTYPSDSAAVPGRLWCRT